MPDERNARPVSGEIMAAGTAATEPARTGMQADVVDAEFETLRPDPSARLSAAGPGPAIATTSALVQGLGSLRKGEVPFAQPRRSPGGPLFWAVGLGLAAGAFWISGGHALVRQAPFVASLPQAEPANPLRISNVASRLEDHGGRSVLLVDGRAINSGGKERPLPPIEISVTGNDGIIAHYRLGTSPDMLPPGGQFGFSSRLEAPKEGVRSVSVTFSE